MVGRFSALMGTGITFLDGHGWTDTYILFRRRISLLGDGQVASREGVTAGVDFEAINSASCSRRWFASDSSHPLYRDKQVCASEAARL